MFTFLKISEKIQVKYVLLAGIIGCLMIQNYLGALSFGAVIILVKFK